MLTEINHVETTILFLSRYRDGLPFIYYLLHPSELAMLRFLVRHGYAAIGAGAHVRLTLRGQSIAARLAEKNSTCSCVRIVTVPEKGENVDACI